MARNPNKKLCGAKTKSGKPCRKMGMPNGRCELHGGKSPKGIAAGRFKHGRYSKYMPSRLLPAYEEAIKDTELMSLRGDVALQESRVAELLMELEEAGAATNWKVLAGVYNEFEAARAAGNSIEAADKLVELGDLIRRGQAQADVWVDLAKTIEQKRRLTETETKRIERERLVMTIEEAGLMVMTLAGIIKKYVTDQKALAMISEDMARMLPAVSSKVIDQE